MIFNSHYNLVGAHAFLSASRYHWINYDEAKLDETYSNWKDAQLGTELHEFAHKAIQLGIKMPKTRKTLNMYINDAIGYRMSSEQVLYYSDNCFGTVDTISFKDDLLRIHDLKTGVTRTSIHQPEIYAALFCLEYKYKPAAIDIELRIYQNDEVLVAKPDPYEIVDIMNKIIAFDKRIDQLKLKG